MPASRALAQLARNRPAYAGTFAPYWLPLAAAGLAAAVYAAFVLALPYPVLRAVPLTPGPGVS